MRKNYKKLTAVALTAVMTLGCTMTAFAANATSGDVSGDLTGTGSYEGAAAEYPEVNVTLPTVSAVSYIDYIVDPNDLITSTLNASGDAINSTYANCEFNSATGVYFKTSDASGDVKAQYTETSRPITVTNESAQDIKLTVKVEELTAASGDVAYSNTAEFASGDTAKKIYLAVTDDTTTKALDASGDATFTIDVSGKPDNFQASHDGSKYSYAKKADASGWATADYKLTGAVNKNATWGEGISFPEVKMTWSWEDKGVAKDAGPSVANVTYSKATGGALTIPCNLGRGSLAASAVTDVVVKGTDGKLYSANGAWNSVKMASLTVAKDSCTLGASWMSGMQMGESQVTVIFDNDLENYVAIKVTVTN